MDRTTFIAKPRLDREDSGGGTHGVTPIDAADWVADMLRRSGAQTR